MRNLISSLLVLCALATAHAQAPAAQSKSEWASPHNPLVGKFKLTGTSDDMQGGKVKMTGTVEGKMVVGGKWLEHDITMKMGDAPAQGRMMVAYDEASKTYVSSWIDSMAAMVITAKGTREGNTVTMVSDEVEMMGMKMKVKVIITFKDKDTFTEIVQTDMGQGFKTMQDLTCTRIK